MAGLQPGGVVPQEMVVHSTSKILEVRFSDGARFSLPFEYLRVYSPSAEVQGHGPGQEVLQTGKRQVDIVALDPVGHYGVQPTFSDGHSTGIYTWDYLYQLGAEQSVRWQSYLDRLEAAQRHRDDPMPEAAGKSCGGH
ncbi:DUF971 domain-containing protein [Curvibacter sp. APW13]|uniref:DUF971 domain-containing protein n=1 Tax=Curvibacter sp. APW13 TaxID=3077236 RepID=UPI0028DD5D42|nr:DUF971 domain-containing protein [Curvibacter sp. APW13]MDT8989508.1 DUF971 domain-containing protein [Curvibacter sp. APW13]